MAVPVDVVVRFGKDITDAINPSDVLTDELKFRMGCLLTGRYETYADGRCVIAPENGMGGTFPPFADARDSVCLGVDLGPISIGYCKDV
jgi:hypothetical protein